MFVDFRTAVLWPVEFLLQLVKNFCILGSAVSISLCVSSAFNAFNSCGLLCIGIYISLFGLGMKLFLKLKRTFDFLFLVLVSVSASPKQCFSVSLLVCLLHLKSVLFLISCVLESYSCHYWNIGVLTWWHLQQGGADDQGPEMSPLTRSYTEHWANQLPYWGANVVRKEDPLSPLGKFLVMRTFWKCFLLKTFG